MMHVVTACSRPENLPKLEMSLCPHREFIAAWWIVGRTEGPGWAVQIDAEMSIGGQAQKNLALGKMPLSRDWVYFLDDDTILCSDLPWVLVKTEADGLIFSSDLMPGAAPKLGHIDQCQYALRRDLIGDARIPEAYDGDGQFIVSLYEAQPERFQITDRELAYYNALRPTG